MSDLQLDEPVVSQLLDLTENEEAGHASEGEVDKAGTNGLEAIADELKLAPSVMVMERAPVAPNMTGLASAAEVTFGQSPVVARPESIIGTDDRVRINSTDRYPWRVHASLRITARDGSNWLGTAFFIGPRVLATAGHNLYFHGANPARRGWARSIEVMPGRDGDELPFGSAVSAHFSSVRGWTENADPDYDYGVIILDEPLGSRTGWLGFGSYGDSTLTSTYGNLSGYPGDKGGDEQWYMCRRIASVSGRQVFYDIDTFGGQSGSAVYRIADGSRYAVGIHAYGTGGSPYNAATRITKPVFDNLLAWKNANP